MHTKPRLLAAVFLLAAVAPSAGCQHLATVHPPEHVEAAAPLSSAIEFHGDPRPPVQAPAVPKPSPRPAPRHTARPHRAARVEHTAAPAANRSRHRPRLVITGTGLRAYAAALLGAGQFSCFDAIVNHESGWSVTASNPSSGAYGLMQALPGSKMAGYGANWRTDGRVQIRWGIHYVNRQYGSACGAWGFWQSHGWY